MKKITRRTFVSAAAATPLAAGLASQTQNAPRAAPPELAEISSGDMVVSFDRTQGVVFAVKSRSNPLGSNFIGNSQNMRGIQPGDSRSLGDVVMTVWAIRDPERLKSDLEGRTYRSAGGWQRETSSSNQGSAWATRSFLRWLSKAADRRASRCAMPAGAGPACISSAWTISHRC